MKEPPSAINRRTLLQLAAVAGSASTLGAATGNCQQDSSSGFRIIDTNVSLFHWPFRRLPLDETEALVDRLRSLGVVRAWAGSFEGLLHRDVAGVNQRLARTCRRYAELVPIGSINLELPAWEDDLRRCVDEHDMPGVRLHPNYHGYRLDDRRFERLLERATAAGRFVQIAAAMEDTRTQHRLLRASDVDLTPLEERARATPAARIQILNARPRGAVFDALASAPGIYFDTARIEGTDGVPAFIERAAAMDRVLFGTHAPFLIPAAALIRVHESGGLDEAGIRAVLSQNAQRMFSGSGV